MQANINIKNSKFYGLFRAQIRGVKSKITDKIMDLEIEMFLSRVFSEGLYEREPFFNEIIFAYKKTYNLSYGNLEN